MASRDAMALISCRRPSVIARATRSFHALVSTHRQHQNVSAALARPPSATSDFHELRERSLLRHVISSATEGDAESVLNAMDQFWDTYYDGSGTKEWKLRSSALDAAVLGAKPQLCMELGTYCGYTNYWSRQCTGYGMGGIGATFRQVFCVIQCVPCAGKQLPNRAHSTSS